MTAWQVGKTTSSTSASDVRPRGCALDLAELCIIHPPKVLFKRSMDCRTYHLADGNTRYSHVIGKEIWKYPKAMEVPPRSKHCNEMDQITILLFLLYQELSCDTKEIREALHICLFQMLQNKPAWMDLLGPCSTGAHEGEKYASNCMDQRTQDLLTT